MTYLKSLTCITILLATISEGLADCTIDIDKLKTDHPLILANPITGTAGPVILYPAAGSRSITLKANAKIDLGCTAANVKAGTVEWTSLETATCSSGTKVTIKGKTVDVNDLICTKKLASTAKQTTTACGSGKIVEIGYAVGSNFVKFFTVCFNSATKTPIYSKHELRGTPEKTSGSNVCGRSDTWVQEGYYSPEKLNTLYTKKEEQKNINAQLTLVATDTKFIDTKSSDKFLAKGHLTACADFIYSAGRVATFHYVNAAPQWQLINRLSWFNLEKNLRNHAIKQKISLVVYTGVYQQLELPNNKGNPIKVFLSPNKVIPVPQIFWKLVFDPKTKAGVAVLLYNNIYTMITKPYEYCKDVSNTITWLNFAHSNPQKEGFIYACEVNSDFKKKNIIPSSIPELGQITKLLK